MFEVDNGRESNLLEEKKYLANIKTIEKLKIEDKREIIILKK